MRFDFTATNHNGSKLWDEARSFKKAGCGAVSMLTNDPSLEPPLSAAEIAYQCGGKAPPCKLQWNPGMLCYDLPNASWVVPPATKPSPGLNERAALLGYRSVAAASGTTATVLEMAKLLGFTSDELALFRCVHSATLPVRL